MSSIDKIAELLGNEASLLEHRCQTVPKEQLHLPGPDFVDRVFVPTDRSPNVLRNMQLILNS
ncbi:MAG: fructose-bisphosphate aldolase, partial [Candidatus Sericytochromatia bacterium]